MWTQSIDNLEQLLMFRFKLFPADIPPQSYRICVNFEIPGSCPDLGQRIIEELVQLTL